MEIPPSAWRPGLFPHTATRVTVFTVFTFYLGCWCIPVVIYPVVFEIVKSVVYHIEAETKWTPFARRHFQWIFFNENVWISIKISLKFVPRGPISNIPVLVQIMAWRWPGDKPLSEPMTVCWRIYASLSLNELFDTEIERWTLWQWIKRLSQCSSFYFLLVALKSVDLTVFNASCDYKAVILTLFHFPVNKSKLACALYLINSSICCGHKIIYVITSLV